MVCQYSTRGLVSSEKHARDRDPEAVEDGGDASHIVPGSVMVGRPVRCPHPSRPSPWDPRDTRVAIEVLRETICTGHVPRSSASHRHEVAWACHPASVTHQFVKHVPRLTMHGHESASLRPRAPDDVFYKSAADHVYIRDGVMPCCRGDGP
jgi:hypothetical protein